MMPDRKLQKSILVVGCALCAFVTFRWFNWKMERALSAILLLLFGPTLLVKFHSGKLEKMLMSLGIKLQKESNLKIIFFCITITLGVISSLASSTISEVLLIIVIICLYIQVNHGTKNISLIPPSDVFEKPRRERLISGSWQQDVQILDSFEEGYFILQGCLKYSDEPFLLKYVNTNGGKILSNFSGPFSLFLSKLFDADNLEQTLAEIIDLLFSKEELSGLCKKGFFKLMEKRKSSDKGEDIDGHSLKITKALAFKTYKVKIIKLNHSEIVVIISEKSRTSSLNIDKSFRDTIICTLSHELRNLLTGVIGNLELFGENIALQGEEKMNHKIATSSTYVLANRLNDLFDYIQIGYKDMRIHYLEFTLHDFLKEIEGICKWIALQKQIKLNMVQRKNLPKSLIGDRARLMQITLNVLIKAIEFTEYGSTIELVIKQTKERKISFAVRSYGLAMQQKLEQYLNNSPMKKSILSRSMIPGDTEAVQNLESLSLEICQLICKQMGTNIIVKISEKYSQFKFTIRNGFSSPILISTGNNKNKLRRNSSHQDRKDKTGTTELGINSRTGSTVEDVKSILSMTTYMAKLAPQPPPIKSHFSQKQEELDDYQDSDVPSECGEAERISLPHSPLKTFLFNSVGIISPPLPQSQPEQEANPFPLSRYKSAEPEVGKLSLRQRTKKKRRCTFATNIKGLKASRTGTVDDVEKCQVLITDDDTLNRNVLKKLLKNRGLNGLEACDGSEAVNIVEKHLGAGQLGDLLLVFMDLQMPVMNGIEAVSKIKCLCAERKVHAPLLIGLSCSTVEDDRKRFIRAGLDEFVSKPITKKKLDYILSKYLGMSS